jgi:hypothetical protein
MAFAHLRFTTLAAAFALAGASFFAGGCNAGDQTKSNARNTAAAALADKLRNSPCLSQSKEAIESGSDEAVACRLFLSAQTTNKYPKKFTYQQAQKIWELRRQFLSTVTKNTDMAQFRNNVMQQDAFCQEAAGLDCMSLLVPEMISGDP